MSNIQLAPIGLTQALKDQVYSMLKVAIAKMDIYSTPEPPKLDERRLAEDLGVSRTPVREVLSRLEQEGLVNNVPRRGTYIVRKTKKEILEVVCVWALIWSGMAMRQESSRTLRKAPMKAGAARRTLRLTGINPPMRFTT